MKKYHSGSHCKYLTQYHIILCPKFRFSVFNNEMRDNIIQCLRDICVCRKYDLKEIEAMPDHIHMFIDIPCTEAPSEAVRKIKSQSTVTMFRKYPKLRSFYNKCGQLWSDGYFVTSVGVISEEAVLKYIREQANVR